MPDKYSKNTATFPRAGKLSAMITTAIRLIKKGFFKNFIPAKIILLSLIE